MGSHSVALFVDLDNTNFVVIVLNEDVFIKYLEDCSKLFECPENKAFGVWADALRSKKLPLIDGMTNFYFISTSLII